MTELISHISVNVGAQRLVGVDDLGNQQFQCAISTASNGVGQQTGSECTPLGRHRIRAKIGHQQAINTVFVGRRPTGEIFSEKLAAAQPKRDWILTRILWLCGNQPGINRGGQVDTQRRFIYLHGAPDSHAMGVPGSHGCIKMRNDDIISLFDLVELGTSVTISE